MAKPSATWAIVTALAAQLATITIANGYLTDVGNNVWTTDNQRPSEDALGLAIYSESITGPGLDKERPGKPVRDLTLLVEAAIDADLDSTQSQIHDIIEDIEVCMKQYALAQQSMPPPQQTPMHVADIAILNRPEGAAFIGVQARIVSRYFR